MAYTRGNFFFFNEKSFREGWNLSSNISTFFHVSSARMILLKKKKKIRINYNDIFRI